MAKQTDLQRAVARIDAEIARLQGIRDYLLKDAPEAEKPKRTRKARKAPGLPPPTEV